MLVVGYGSVVAYLVVTQYRVQWSYLLDCRSLDLIEMRLSESRFLKLKAKV